ncbi:MAG: glycosyltransferase [Nitrospiraceae bacterium]
MNDFLTNTVMPILLGIEWVILGYFLMVTTLYAVLLVSAGIDLRPHLLKERGENRRRLLQSAMVPRISLIAPAFNEGKTIADSVRALLGLQYPRLEVVVVNDGSKDNTLAVLQDQFDLVDVHPIFRRRIQTKPVLALYRSRIHPNLIVVDKENGGKADALNVGLNIAQEELVCAIDADTLIEADALQRMVRPFLESDQVVAAGATIRPVNDCTVQGGRVTKLRVPRRLIAGVQVAEYLRAFLFGRLGWNRLGGNLIISGAFGLFRREAVIESGGYRHDTVGEDMELVVRLRRLGYERKQAQDVVFIPDPVAWTEVPESMRVLGRQRDRWHRGLADVLWRHRRLFFNPRYGSLGMVAVPYFVIVELFAPVIEAVGLIISAFLLWMGGGNQHVAILFFLVAYGYGTMLSIWTLVIEEYSFRRIDSLVDRALLIGWSLVENLGYRQVTVYWRLRGLVKYWRGRKDWGTMERAGFKKVAPVGVPAK